MSQYRTSEDHLPEHTPSSRVSPLQLNGWLLGVLLTSACTGFLDGSSGTGPGGPGIGASNGVGGPTSGSGTGGQGVGAGVGGGAGSGGDIAKPGDVTQPGLDEPPLPSGGNQLGSADLKCAGANIGAIPARLVRLTNDQYRNTVAAALGSQPDSKVFLPFGYIAAADRYPTLARSYTMTDDELGAAFTAAEQVADQLVQADKAGCIAANLAGDGIADCVKKTVQQIGATLFRRPVTADEAATYAKLTTDNLGALKGGRQAAVALAVATMLMSPDFLYRAELGEGPADAHGRMRLGPWELASAISYTLADAPPDAQLQAAARDGKLTSVDDVKGQVMRYVGSTTKGTSRFYGFMKEYLGWERVPTKDQVAIDSTSKEGYFNPVTEGPRDPDATIQLWLESNGEKDFWKTALTSHRFIIHGRTFESWDLLRSSYGVGLEYADSRTLDIDNRAGFLSMPFFMLNLSTFTGENKAVQRGRWIRENIECQSIPEVPIGVVPVLPPDPLPMRAKLKLHTKDASCNACHQFMDPMGLVFEGHDDVGRTRALDHGQPVDESGAVVGTGTIDGPVKGIPELATKLSGWQDGEFCFIRQNARYLFGREETVPDACSLRDAQKAYEDAGGSYVALVNALLTSDSFLYRTKEPPQ